MINSSLVLLHTFIVLGEIQPQKELVNVRSIPEYIGLVGVGVSGIIVLIVVGLLVLAVILMGVGAYESATNPHISQDTAQEYAQLQQNISNAQAGISGAVDNVTGSGVMIPQSTLTSQRSP